MKREDARLGSCGEPGDDAVQEFAVGCPSGLYRIDPGQVACILDGNAFPSSFLVASLDGDDTGTRVGLFHALASALRFPDYFGHNWDAVYDCLTDLSWQGADGLVLVLNGMGRMATSEPDQWQVAVTVLQDACAYWRPIGRHLYAIVPDPPPCSPELAALPESCLSGATRP